MTLKTERIIVRGPTVLNLTEWLCPFNTFPCVNAWMRIPLNMGGDEFKSLSRILQCRVLGSGLTSRLTAGGALGL